MGLRRAGHIETKIGAAAAGIRRPSQGADSLASNQTRIDASTGKIGQPVLPGYTL
jgi:hypothetical protein